MASTLTRLRSWRPHHSASRCRQARHGTTRVLTLPCIVAALLTAAAAGAAPPTNEPLGAVLLAERVPDVPMGGSLGLEQPLCGVVPGLPEGHQLDFVWGTKEGRGEAAWLIQTGAPDGSFMLHGLSLAAAGDWRAAQIDLPATGGQQVGGLDLWLHPSSHVLLFRWSGATTWSPGPGASPGSATAASQVQEFRVEAPAPLAGVGAPLPPIPVLTMERRPKEIRARPGRVLVINWWATSCSPCVAEIPGLNKVRERFAGQADFVAIALDSRERLDAFLARQPFDYEQHMATDATGTILGNSFPRNVVVDAAGLVVLDRTGAGPRTPGQVADAIEQALAAGSR